MNTIVKTHCNADALLGIDIGSTTAKLVLIENDLVTYEKYVRHYSQVRQKALEMISEAQEQLRGKTLAVAITGSAGMGLASAAKIPFVQEVYATSETVKALEPNASVEIELGGEDAKIIFFEGGVDPRMNGSCAGGTGAFIDQMATLLNVSVTELDELSLRHKRIYPIASRCGVFAKSDIQPLLNQGATREDIAASIYQAVVNQSIAGLAQGRSINGRVVFLGGPLYFCRGLRERFVETLKLTPENAVFPPYALYAVAIGAAIYAGKQDAKMTYEQLLEGLRIAANEKVSHNSLAPLFASEDEFCEFINRHNKSTIESVEIEGYRGNAYLGIDCGSTTTKLVLISEQAKLLYSFYDSNKGNPAEIVREQLEEIYEKCADRIKIAASAVTGYGEELIKNGFSVDFGIVETIAHYTAARFFDPKVDFILDIGGQDIKCFKIKDNAIDSIMLNEACSSGCGSFLETFAKSMGCSIAEFAQKGLFAKHPVDLGSRCTVFMNSSVKQAQKDGASAEDISAGLSMSVVRNAIYKVIRASSADELGSHIIVQGGTFLNDAVLRSFELLLGRNVIRPSLAGHMGAYGAALYARASALKESSLITQKELRSFTHTSKTSICRGCTNNCHLTVNTFSGGKKYISGNQCERGIGIKEADIREIPNLHEYKRRRLLNLPQGNAVRATIGLPMALGMYELAPLWHAIFTSLGFRVITSGASNHKLYEAGQFSIPSDTACYPAKLMHGHIEKLLSLGADAIFYPALSYNFEEGASANHYNCPVVAYYSELLNANMPQLAKTKFLYPYLYISDEKTLSRLMYDFLNANLGSFSRREVASAVKAGYVAYNAYMEDIKIRGEAAIAFARENNKKILILAGRPYHIDPEIGHGIDKLATSLGFVVVSEDSVYQRAKQLPSLSVLNQWTYHSRLYRAAQFAVENDDVELVQLVSFGCGIDAITTDEVRSILERGDKLYTQIKIDEITNLGAVKIRLRSLIGAIEEREKEIV